MNSINKDLEFTTEVESDFDKLRLPTLSFEMWSEESGIRHSYFEKGMRSQVLTMQRSSQAETSKFSILVNELVRRFEVMDDEIKIEEEIEIIDHFSKQLRNSGYEYKQARDIVQSALKGIERKRENRKGIENKRRYQSGEETLEKRIYNKLIESSTWFREKEKEKVEKGEKEFIDRENMGEKENSKSWKGWRICKRRKERKILKNLKGIRMPVEEKEEREKKIEGVVFIQHTLHSELARNIRRRLKDVEKACIIKVKIVERTGDKIVDLLHKSDAWANRDCLRKDCWPCASAGENGTKGKCNRRSVLYETYCETCEEENKLNMDSEKEIREKGSEKIENKRKRKIEIGGKEACQEKIDYKVKYIGETWRSGYERGKEHQEDLKYVRENSHLLKHVIEDHPGKKVDEIKFGMRVKLTFKSALERQITEAVEIHQAKLKGYKLLNSKSEYNRCSLPRLTVGNNKELLEKLIEERDKE